MTSDVYPSVSFVERFRVQPETIALLVFLEPFPRTRHPLVQFKLLAN